MAGPRVFGVGIGVFILAVLWAVSFLLSVFLSKTQGISRAAGVFIAALLGTVLLLVLPQGEGQRTKSVDMTDPLFIWRNSLTVLLGLCTLASPALLLKMHWGVPVQAHSLNRMRVVRRRSVAVGATAEESKHT